MATTISRLKRVTLDIQDNGEGKYTFEHEQCIEHDGKLIPVGTERAAITLEALRVQPIELPVDEQRIVRDERGSRIAMSGALFDSILPVIAEAQRRDAAERAARNAEAEARAAAAAAAIEARKQQIAQDEAGAAAEAEAERLAIESEFGGRAR